MQEDHRDRVFSDMSVRETTRYIYPYIKTRTIYQWIEEGVFTPHIYVRTPSGPGQGTRLDWVDLVTLGLLHSMFSLGVRFSHFNPGCSPTPHLMIHFWHELPPGGLGLLEKGVHFSPGGRDIQDYLTRYNSKVLGYLQMYHMHQTDPEIAPFLQFWPHMQNGFTEEFVGWLGDAFKAPRVGHVFLNAREWGEYVWKMLGLHDLS